MNNEIAKKIGSSLALKAVTVGVIMAYLIMGLVSSGNETNFFEAMFWISKIDSGVISSCVVSVAVFYACGYYFGGMAGVAILVKQYSHFWVGPCWGLFTLLATVFIGNLATFGQGAVLLFYVLIVGIFPAILVGFWLGSRIKSNVKTDT